MTNEEKLTHLLKVLKIYAEAKHCYDRQGDDYNPNSYTHCDVAFEDGIDYGWTNFARTLLEQIGENFEYPCMREEE